MRQRFRRYGAAVPELEAQRLGELPDDILLERPDVTADDLYRPVTVATTAAPDVAPSDYPGVTGLNVPKFGTLVQSVFDTRPINGYDFYDGDRQTVLVDPCTLTVIPMSLFGFRVPQGYVAVVRRIILSNVIGIPAVDIVTGILGTMNMSVLLSNVAVPGMSNVLVLGMDAIYDTHIIADENQIIDVVLSDFGAAATSVTITGLLYGNLLLKRGLPPTFEVGSLPF